ncbi:arabinan endo-1,5-alpha-L-arabinosidase [Cohnella fermenti]|uniref:Arabinan endo-1,5-alpha-L-arabinosidase n=1 Tax=Cohnella fermenti TaxID=2565925 RepID=A0A4S4BEZ2_9BACL|nr:arabinan endo-1,5-alpha-L-arabinosidase [Cohnella fermenti]THF72677.1 arabinan endo-1,5-alpha-L-arabinosidase [Cohnella fermenti]
MRIEWPAAQKARRNSRGFLRRLGVTALALTTLSSPLIGSPGDAAAASPPTLTDLWNGDAHFELYMNRPMDGQSASGSNIVVVGDNWYWFHRNVVDVAAWKLGTVVEKSTDNGQTWSSPVAAIQPTAGTPWAQMVTDGNFQYDSASNKWRALMQTHDGSNPWTLSYFERSGADPMGAFTTPSGFSNPAVDAKEIWSQITTAAGTDSVDIPGGTNLIFDEGTPQIVAKIDGKYYVTFHGASSTGGTTHGYRGIATTTDWQNWTSAAADTIVDQYDAEAWNVAWNPGGPVGVGAASILYDDGYYYQIIEGADVNLNGFAGQNWPMGLMRSTSLTSTSWDNWSGNALFPATGQVIEWQYPTIFKDSAGVTYVAMSKYAPENEAGFRIYKLAAGAPTADSSVLNTVINPSFETAYSWSLGTFSRSTDRAHTGQYSLKSTANGVNAMTSSPIPVQPETNYRLSGWIYKSSNSGNAYLDMNDIAGEASPGVNNGSGGVTWTYVSQVWNSGTNTSLSLRCVTDSGINAAVYFDDLSLVKLEPGNTVLNPSFESFDSSSPVWSSSAMSVSSDRAHIGTYSLKTTSTTAANAITAAPIYVQPYTNYKLSGWIYKTSASGNAYLDMNDIAREAQTGVGNGDGAGVWTYVSQIWNSGSNTTLRLRCVTDGGLSAAAYFDDISLAKQGDTTGQILFGTGLEPDQTALTWSDTPDAVLNVSNSVSSVRTGETSRSGNSSIKVSGTDNSSTISYSDNKVFDVNIPVTSTTKLSYWFYPLNENSRHVTVDLVFTDGSTLRDSGATDFEGISMHPNIARGIVNTWRQVQCNIGQWASGKTIDRILIDYDQGPNTGTYTAYVDDIAIVN